MYGAPPTEIAASRSCAAQPNLGGWPSPVPGCSRHTLRRMPCHTLQDNGDGPWIGPHAPSIYTVLHACNDKHALPWHSDWRGHAVGLASGREGRTEVDSNRASGLVRSLLHVMEPHGRPVHRGEHSTEGQGPGTRSTGRRAREQTQHPSAEQRTAKSEVQDRWRPWPRDWWTCLASPTAGQQLEWEVQANVL